MGTSQETGSNELLMSRLWFDLTIPSGIQEVRPRAPLQFWFFEEGSHGLVLGVWGQSFGVWCCTQYTMALADLFYIIHFENGPFDDSKLGGSFNFTSL